MAVICAFVLVKYQSPHEKFFPKKPSKRIQRKLKVASVATPAIPRIGSDSKEVVGLVAPNSQKLEEVRNTPPLRQSTCLSSFQKLAASPLLEVRNTETAQIPAQTFRKLKKVAPLKIAIRRKVKKKIVVPAIPEWVEKDFENPQLNSQDALDNPAPLDDLAETAFKESWVDDSLGFTSLLAAVQWQNLEQTNLPFEMERPLYVQESVFQKLPFTDLNEKLELLKKSEKSNNLIVRAPQSRVAWAKVTTTSLPSTEQLPTDKAPTLVTKADTQEPTGLNTQVLEAKPEAAPVLEVEARGKVGTLAPTLAGATQGVFEFKQTENPQNPAQQAVTHPVKDKRSLNQPTVSNQTGPVDGDEEPVSTGGKIYGEVVADQDTLSWLKSRRAFVELYLNRVGSQDPQDTIFLLDYQFPSSGSSFEIDGTGMKGKYKLFAGVYVPESSVPVAQIPYSKVLTADNAREKVYLTLNREALSSAPSREETQRIKDHVSLTLTLFDGAPANYRKPKTIQSGQVQIVGFPELGTFQSDKDGNVRIPAVPATSELVVEASAPGYFPGRQIVPIFTTAAYSPIYLVEKDKVDVVTRFFTKRLQQPQKGVVMGRAYDNNTRAPKTGETFSLSHRKGNAVYFGALPDTNAKATLDTGLFGFFNVEASIRSIGRSGNQHSLLVNVEPGYGYFLELGRGGSRNILGHLFDPFAGQDVNGTVQLVGDALSPEETNDKGQFSLPDLDLPPGVVTLEAYADGYPRTWFTIPWSARESEKERAFYMMERDLIKESANRIARVRHEKNTGVIVGGAHHSLFKAGRNKIGVTLLDTKGHVVASEHGPFSLSQVPKNKSTYVLTAADPGFSFFNLPPGEYLLKMTDETGKTFRAHVVRVGVERVSVLVN